MATPSIPQASGIYCIFCLSNRKFYIGSSNNLQRRCYGHWSDLRHNQHCNQHLQNAFNKYGEQNFIFVVLEYCDKTVLIEREQYFIDQLQPFSPQGFNISSRAEHNTLGQKRSPETIEKMRKARIGKQSSLECCIAIGKRSKELWQNPIYRARQSQSRTGKKRSAEFCERISIARRGIKFSPETIKRLSESHKGKSLKPESVAKRSETNRKEYIVTSPDGIETRIKGLDKFCTEHGLRANTMSSVATGKYKTCNGGWKCRHV